MDDELVKGLRIARSDRGGIAELILDGELDVATAPDLDQQLSKIQLDGAKHVVIDLREVTFVDSTGLASLVVAHRDAQSSGHTVAFRSGGGQVQRLFELTGVAEQFTFEN